MMWNRTEWPELVPAFVDIGFRLNDLSMCTAADSRRRIVHRIYIKNARTECADGTGYPIACILKTRRRQCA